jgi:hypothetical protein
VAHDPGLSPADDLTHRRPATPRVPGDPLATTTRPEGLHTPASDFRGLDDVNLSVGTVMARGAFSGGGGSPSAREAARIGRYAVLSRLGEGGMGEVLSAYDEVLDRRVALKLVRAPERGDLRLQAQLMREAQALARLSHPNIVQVYEAGADGDELYLAMELVRGVTLATWLSDQPRSRAEIVGMFHQIGQGLAAAHRAGLVHRDFKPKQSRLPPKASPSAKRRGSPQIGAFEREAVRPGVVRSGQDGPKLAQT